MARTWRIALRHGCLKQLPTLFARPGASVRADLSDRSPHAASSPGRRTGGGPPARGSSIIPARRISSALSLHDSHQFLSSGGVFSSPTLSSLGHSPATWLCNVLWHWHVDIE